MPASRHLFAVSEHAATEVSEFFVERPRAESIVTASDTKRVIVGATMTDEEAVEFALRYSAESIAMTR